MVTPGRDLANILFPSFVNLQSIQQELSMTQHINIETNIPRGQSISVSSNISRDLSVYSNISFRA